VKAVIATQERWSAPRKSNVVKAYSLFAKMMGFGWSRPRMVFRRGLPRPPTTEQVKQLIAGASKKYSTIFRFLAETGASPIEAACLTEKDFDFERGIVYITGRKGHLDRAVPMSGGLVALMKQYFQRYDRIPRSDQIGRKFRKYRDQLAKKLNDTALKRIRLYDLRHYFGTILYEKTKDILYVKEMMGHTKIETTMIYTKLTTPASEEYVCRVARTVEQVAKLIESGFEYVCDVDCVKLFRKRKTLADALREGGPKPTNRPKEGPGTS